MAFIPVREIIYKDRLQRAKEVKDFKESFKVFKAVSRDRMKESLDRSLEHIKILESSLRQVHFLREKKKIIKLELEDNKRALERIAARNRIKGITADQDRKIKLRKKIKTLGRYEGDSSRSPLSESISPKLISLRNKSYLSSHFLKNLNFF
jgi:hypothetical protein